MRNTKRVRLVVTAMLITSIGLQSCNVIRGIIGGTEETNKAPSVSLTASSYSIMDGATITLYATGTDPDGDSLSYSWYVNSSYQSGVYSSVATWNSSGWGGNTVTIQVIVSDGELTASDSVSIYVAAAPTNHAPTVTLTANDTSAYSDQDITFTATASDSDGDTLTYSWQVNGTTQSNTTSSVTYYWLTSTNIAPTVTVSVSDGKGGTDTDSVTISVTAAASLRVNNASGYTISDIYVSKSTDSSWGTDILSSYLYNGYLFVVYGIPGSYTYDFRADDYYYGYYWEAYGYTMYSGYYRYFNLYSSTCTVSAYANSSIEAQIPMTTERSARPVLNEGASEYGFSVRPIGSVQEQLSPDRDEAIPFSVLTE